MRQHTTFSSRRHLVAAVTLSCLLVALEAAPALAAPGDLDPTFGSGGTATTDFADGAYANAVAIQADGKIVVVGAAVGPSASGEFALARYETDGSLDPTFDGDGMVTTAIAGGGDEATAVAIQPNGRIVVAGTDSRERFAVVRYRADGSLDTTFGGDGIVRTNLTAGEDLGLDMVLQPDGKIVVAGPAGSAARFALVRYRRDGALDPRFGDGGTVIGRRGVLRALALQPDGRIVVTGYDGYGLVVVRYQRNGSLDRSFGEDGVVRKLETMIFPLEVAVQPNGRILVGGDFDIFAFGLARFTADGRLDPSFGRDGVVRTRVLKGAEQAITALAVQADGRIVAAGYAGPHEGGTGLLPSFALARYLRNGALDTAFGGDGKVTTTFAEGATASGSALQVDGAIVVVGTASQTASVAFALARYLP